ncbi:hypothetical protein J6590_096422 [Homalodisca vitripennis]|nr:hypothetical protein J6590_096422 [Homalodisca vitripennis]
MERCNAPNFWSSSSVTFPPARDRGTYLLETKTLLTIKNTAPRFGSKPREIPFLLRSTSLTAMPSCSGVRLTSRNSRVIGCSSTENPKRSHLLVHVWRRIKQCMNEHYTNITAVMMILLRKVSVTGKNGRKKPSEL